MQATQDTYLQIWLYVLHCLPMYYIKKSDMKSLILLIALATMSCTKEVVSPDVTGLIVKEVCCPERYYAEILHREMYKVGDTLRVTYNQMPKHQRAYPSRDKNYYTTVVIVRM